MKVEAECRFMRVTEAVLALSGTSAAEHAFDVRVLKFDMPQPGSHNRRHTRVCSSWLSDVAARSQRTCLVMVPVSLDTLAPAARQTLKSAGIAERVHACPVCAQPDRGATGQNIAIVFQDGLPEGRSGC